MTRFVLLTAVGLVLSACSTGTAAPSTSAEWCREYEGTVAAAAKDARGLESGSVSASEATRLLASAAREQELAQAAGDAGWLAAENVEFRVQIGDEVLTPMLEKVSSALSDGGALATVTVAAAVSRAQADAEDLARSSGYGSLDEAVEDYGAAIESLCNVNPRDILTTEPVT